MRNEIFFKNVAENKAMSLKQKYKLVKDLGGTFKNLGLKAYNSKGANKVFDDFLEANKATFIDTKTKGPYNKKARELGYTDDVRKASIKTLSKYIYKEENKDIGLDVEISYIVWTDEEQNYSPLLKERIIRENPERIKKKTISIKSKRKNKKSDVKALEKRYGDTIRVPEGYAQITNVKVRETKSLPKYNVKNVPMKDRHSPKLITFDTKGQLVADYIQNHNDQCVLDFISRDYMSRYGHKRGDTLRNITLMNKEELAEEISDLWNKQSVKTCNCVNPLNCECENTTYNALTDGVNLLQLELWCRKKNIGLRALDNNMKQIITFIGSDKITPMYIIQDNGHLYPVISKEIRKTLQQSGRYDQKERDKEGNIKEKKQKEIKYTYEYYDIEDKKKNKKKDEEEEIIDILLKYCKDIKNTKLIIEENILEDIFLDFLVLRNEQYSTKYKSNNLTEILLPNNNAIVFNEDVRSVIHICKILDVSFENQSIIGMTHLLLKRLTDDEYPLKKLSSNFTEDILDTIKNDLPCHNWVKSYEQYAIQSRTQAFDINKAYSSIIEDEEMNWLTLDITSKIQDFDGLISEDKLYYVNKIDDLLFQNAGWYFHNLVQTGLEDGLITLDDIKYEIVGKSQQTDMFNKLVEYLYDTFPEFKDKEPTKCKTCGKYEELRYGENEALYCKRCATSNMIDLKSLKIAKRMVNLYVGNLGRTHNTVGYTRWTTSLDQAFSDTKASDSFVFSQVHNGKTVYKISNSEVREIDSINFLNQRQVVQTGYLKVYNLIKQLTKNEDSKLIAVKTDCVYVQNPSDIKLSNERGGIKLEKISQSAYEKCTRIVNNISYEEKTFNTEVPDFKQLTVNDEYDIDDIVQKIIDGKNVLLTGRAGCGKSHILKKLIKRLEHTNVKIKIGAPTHQAKKLLGEKAKTVHNLFGHDIVGKIHNVKFDDNSTIIIDEVSMIHIEFWSSIIKIRRQQPDINFILCGDFNQLPAVGEENTDVYNTKFLRDIVDYQLNLTVNKRCSKDSQLHFDIMTQAINGEKIDYEFPQGDDNIVNHLCFTNAKRRSINNKFMKKFRGSSYLECGDIFVYENLPMICKKNFRGKNGLHLNNGDRFTVTGYDDKNIYTDIDIVIPIYKDIHIDFQPAYAITVHSSQGTTITTAYTLHETEKYTDKMLYVALSRCSDLKLIHI